MPLTIRQLPTTDITKLIDNNSLPQNRMALNPSRSNNNLYIRIIEHSQSGEKNFANIINLVDGRNTIIDSPFNLLYKTMNLFTGIEDLRIVEFKNRVWFSGTTTHGSNHQINDLIVGCFNESLTAVERVEPLEIGSRPVKNVCAFVYKDQICLLDTFFKKIYIIETTGEKLEIKLFKELSLGDGIKLDGIRGSSSPIHLHGSTWGCVVHDIIFRQNKTLVTRLSYIHHWMEFDIELGLITYLSSPFYIAHWGIEYISGVHKEGNVITLYFGIEDKMAFSAKTTLTDLRVGY